MPRSKFSRYGSFCLAHCFIALAVRSRVFVLGIGRVNALSLLGTGNGSQRSFTWALATRREAGVAALPGSASSPLLEVQHIRNRPRPNLTPTWILPACTSQIEAIPAQSSLNPASCAYTKPSFRLDLLKYVCFVQCFSIIFPRGHRCWGIMFRTP